MRFAALPLLAVLVAAPSASTAQPSPAAMVSSIKPDFAAEIPNIPGKSLRTVLVTYAPGGSSPAHTHARSAFILAYVLEGEITSAVNGGAPRTYRAGEHWTEEPGAHHQVSANASKTKPAKLLAIFVVDTGDEPLTTFDNH